MSQSMAPPRVDTTGATPAADSEPTFGGLLRDYRSAANMTQGILAERAGISTRAIQDLERNVSQPHRDTLLRLTEALALNHDARAMLEAAAITRPRRRVSTSLRATCTVATPQRGELDNLPLRLTGFIGRQRELASAVHLLGGAPPVARLLTLTGTGGIGKTRLAVEVAESLIGAAFPDGVWLVELASFTEAGRIRQSIGTILGLREEPGRSFSEVLLDALRPRRMLLVLDNCEHLVQESAQVAGEILGACPSISILATSREPLGILGERVLGVPPLNCPRGTAQKSVDELRQCEAVRLFTERASALCSDFALSSTNGRAVARICEQLDGIPLALELAAARVRALSLEQIVSRLDHCLRVLAVGERTAPGRQQSLEAAVSWSYELLDEPEQRLFTQLAVFAGGWTLDAAEAICGQDGSPSERVVELLARLIDKSLVVADEGSDDGKRYRLLEPIRQFAVAKLREQGQEWELRNRHFDWYVNIAVEFERIVQFTFGPAAPKLAALTRLESNHDNLRAAWQWAAAGYGDVRAGLRMTGALLAFHFNFGFLSEGRAWLAALLGHSAGAEPGSERAQALSTAAVLAAEDGDYAAARLYADEYLRLPASLGTASDEAVANDALGTAAFHEGDLAAASAFYTRAVRLSREAGEVSYSLYLTQLGEVALQERDLDRAQRTFEEAVAEGHAAGVLPAVGLALHGLASVARSRQDAARAETLYEQSVALLDQLGALPHAVQITLVELGYLALERQDVKRARMRFVEALRRSSGSGQRRTVSAALEGMGVLLLEDAMAHGQPLDRALRVLGAAAGAHVGLPAPRGHEVADAALQRARQGPGWARVDELLRDGRALRLEQALEIATG